MASVITSRTLKSRLLLRSHVQLRSLSTTPARWNVSKENQAPHLNFRSMLSALREQGDLVDIKDPVSPHLEVAAVTRRVYETLAPAPLFHNVSGTDPKTGLFKILGAPVGLRKNKKERYARLAIQLGLPATSTPREIVQKLIDTKNGKPLPPVPVSDAPCKQNILKGDEIDLNKWPIPLLHSHDGGTYLSTYGFHVLQTPDKSWTSWSISRTMHHAQEPRQLTAPVMEGQHIAQVRKAWAESGAEDTPWALVLGGPPAAAFVAGMPLPAKVSEDGYIGALCGSPVEVVKCETNDLYVPANSELVIEGRISNSDAKKVPEGPMGEYHGYSFDDQPIKEPLFQVDCVTYRDSPVVPICVAGAAADETHTVWGTAIAAELMDTLQKGNFPVDFVWMPFEAQSCWIVVSVDIKKLAEMNITAEELCRRAGDLIFKTHAGWEAPKVLLVGDDIDITDINQVVWAMATRYRPGADEHVYGETDGIPMLPYMTRAKKEVSDPGKGGKSVMNLLLPPEFKGKRDWVTANFECSYPAEVTEKVLKNWKKWFRDE